MNSKRIALFLASGSFVLSLHVLGCVGFTVQMHPLSLGAYDTLGVGFLPCPCGDSSLSVRASASHRQGPSVAPVFLIIVEVGNPSDHDYIYDWSAASITIPQYGMSPFAPEQFKKSAYALGDYRRRIPAHDTVWVSLYAPPVDGDALRRANNINIQVSPGKILTRENQDVCILPPMYLLPPGKYSASVRE